MSDSFEVRKNINRTVKDGLDQTRRDRSRRNNRQETVYQQMLQIAEEDRQERRKVLNRARAQIMTNIVIQNEKTSLKRTCNPKDDGNLES